MYCNVYVIPNRRYNATTRETMKCSFHLPKNVLHYSSCSPPCGGVCVVAVGVGIIVGAPLPSVVLPEGGGVSTGGGNGGLSSTLHMSLSIQHSIATVSVVLLQKVGFQIVYTQPKSVLLEPSARRDLLA